MNCASDFDPGGKVRTALPAGMVGSAIISPCGRYRPVLTRFCPSLLVSSLAYALWIGMNPSTADAAVNDPTVTREIAFTRDRLGLARYVKCNISDYRATDSKALQRLPAGELRSPENLPTILEQASEAALVILACGDVPKCLRPLARETIARIHELGVRTYCLGLTSEGWPKHPLYLRADTPLLPYPQEALHG